MGLKIISLETSIYTFPNEIHMFYCCWGHGESEILLETYIKLDGGSRAVITW